MKQNILVEYLVKSVHKTVLCRYDIINYYSVGPSIVLSYMANSKWGDISLLYLANYLSHSTQDRLDRLDHKINPNLLLDWIHFTFHRE